MKKFTSLSQKTGEIGENIAEQYFKSKGYFIVERNFASRFGEIDLIVKKNNKIYFVEVKSRIANSITDFTDTEGKFSIVSETISGIKIERLKKTINIYFVKSNWTGDFGILAFLILIDPISKKSKVKIYEIN